jgi:hypothetical protein
MDPNVQYSLTVDEMQLTRSSILRLIARSDAQTYIGYIYSSDSSDISDYTKTANIVQEAIKNKDYHIRKTASNRLEINFTFVEDGISKNRLFYLNFDNQKENRSIPITVPNRELFFNKEHFDLLKENAELKRQIDTLTKENAELKSKTQG